MTDPRPTTILFIGDITGQPALEYLEAHLPAWLAVHPTDFVIANAENLDLQTSARGSCGMTAASLERLFAAGVMLVTGGNHSWDGAEGSSVHVDERVLRPLNQSPHWPGRGLSIVERGGVRLGVVNLASRTAIAGIDDPALALEELLSEWTDQTDAVLVDFHGESVFEKISLAFAFDGQVSAWLGTHTHVPTLDARILPCGTAYVSDVGMTGPSGGAQGYDPSPFAARLKTQGYTLEPMRLASGAVELGAVLLSLSGARATQIERLTDLSSVVDSGDEARGRLD